MSTEIFELSEEEILAIAGAGQIAPPASQSISATAIYPEIENDPPLPPG